MFEFDIEKHEPKTKYNRNGVECYLCGVRKRLIKVTPEERVRQALLNYLLNEMGFPVDRIEVEVPLSHFKKGAPGRADLLVYDNDDERLLLIECKEPDEIFADYVLNQLIRYSEVINAQHFMIVIGRHIRLILTDLDLEKTMEPTGMLKYSAFLEGGEFEIEGEDETDDDVEIPFQEPFENDLIERAVEFGFLGNGAGREFYPFIFNMIGFFFEKEPLSSDVIEDLGKRFTKFGNAGGGAYPGNYRAYIYKRRGDNIIVSFAILGTYNTQIANYKGATCLVIAIDFEKTSHLSLELRIEKYVKIKNGEAVVWHDGTLTVGKLGMAKRKEVLDFVSVKAPHLIKDNRIYLGAFDLSKRISAQKVQAYDFIKRTIEYAIVRDEFRVWKKEQ